ncbi:hypothetical protein Hanom_Chr09g00765581 [Helianthus anomalus]
MNLITITRMAFNSYIKMESELQILSFIFIPICRRCPLCLNLTSFVLNVLKSYTFYPLDLTQLIFLVKSDHPKGTLVFLPFIYTN